MDHYEREHERIVAAVTAMSAISYTRTENTLRITPKEGPALDIILERDPSCEMMIKDGKWRLRFAGPDVDEGLKYIQSYLQNNNILREDASKQP
jgi:hypothetical protein